MYRVIVNQETCFAKGHVKKMNFDVQMKTEKLYEIIGRFTLRFGTPLQVETTDPAWKMFEFFKEESNNGYRCIELMWIEAKDIVQPKAKKIVVVETFIPDDERITTMLGMGLLKA